MLLRISNLVILLMLVACASSSKTLTKKERQLLYYQKLRQSQWDEITNKKYHKDKKVTIESKKAKRPKNRSRKKVAKAPPKKIKVDPVEQRIEIEQKLSFHCMQERIENCDDLSTRAYESCLDKNSPGELDLTKCIERYIRN